MLPSKVRSVEWSLEVGGLKSTSISVVLALIVDLNLENRGWLPPFLFSAHCSGHVAHLSSGKLAISAMSGLGLLWAGYFPLVTMQTGTDISATLYLPQHDRDHPMYFSEKKKKEYGRKLRGKGGDSQEGSKGGMGGDAVGVRGSGAVFCIGVHVN